MDDWKHVTGMFVPISILVYDGQATHNTHVLQLSTQTAIVLRIYCTDVTHLVAAATRSRNRPTASDLPKKTQPGLNRRDIALSEVEESRRSRADSRRHHYTLRGMCCSRHLVRRGWRTWNPASSSAAYRNIIRNCLQQKYAIRPNNLILWHSQTNV